MKWHLYIVGDGLDDCDECISHDNTLSSIHSDLHEVLPGDIAVMWMDDREDRAVDVERSLNRLLSRSVPPYKKCDLVHWERL